MVYSLKSFKLWRDSAVVSCGIIGILSSIISIVGYSIDDIWGKVLGKNPNELRWFVTFLWIMILYVICLFMVLSIKLIKIAKMGISIKIRGINVNIKKGDDIFAAKGWKVIQLNEYFDTQVDDKIIAKNTLHGRYIQQLGGNKIRKLKQIIDKEKQTVLTYPNKDERLPFPLGHIITYEDCMLLAFSRFNENNEAYLTGEDYIQCLMRMWREISRTYANKPINLTLLGSGITRFKDVSEKSNRDLLVLMLYTLKLNMAYINQPITILLTKEVMEEINIYSMKGVC